MKLNITKENAITMVSELPQKNSLELRNLYFQLFGRQPKNLETTSQLIPQLAYKIQEIAYGGLSSTTEAKLIKILRDIPNEAIKPNITPGTKIEKLYHGQLHEVFIYNDHFVYNDINYSSLSAIAKKITGTNWNGRKFFNVK